MSKICLKGLCSKLLHRPFFLNIGANAQGNPLAEAGRYLARRIVEKISGIPPFVYSSSVFTLTYADSSLSAASITIVSLLPT